MIFTAEEYARVRSQAAAEYPAECRREAQGYRVLTIYHSHIDAGAYFSATDKHNALINSEPAYPEATYVVVSVLEGRVADANAFRWDPVQRDFLSVEWEKPAEDARP